MTHQEINDLACEIAEKTMWDGIEITSLFLEALTEANYHSLRKKLEEIVKKEFEL